MQVAQTLRGASTFQQLLGDTPPHVKGRLRRMAIMEIRYGATTFPLHLAITLHHANSMAMRAQIGATMYPFRVEAIYLLAKQSLGLLLIGVITYQLRPERMSLLVQEVLLQLVVV